LKQVKRRAIGGVRAVKNSRESDPHPSSRRVSGH
jgi:hypothetical protein